jgi:VanZ family protein
MSGGTPPMWGQPPSAVQPGAAGIWLPRLSSDRHEVLKAWIAAILWLIVIAIESSALLSAHNTGRILYPLLHYIFGLDWERFHVWHFYIRKSGHVIGYGTLSILLFRAWRATLPAPGNLRWTMRWANIAILGTALVASLDEWHQTFIPSRTGTVHDVVLDTCAGIAAQILILLWWKMFGKGTSSLVPSKTRQKDGFSQ